jgi:hypothetical protein
MRKDLRHVLRTPTLWQGGLRRSALARAIQGSNSIWMRVKLNARNLRGVG